MRFPSVGTVVALWRYPVKSMRGEELPASAVATGGLLGDRAYAVLDRATGLVASAKHPRKWPALLACRAIFAEPPRPGAPPPPVWITLPDGTRLHSEQPDANRILSRALGRDVALIAEAPPQAMREADRTPPDAADGAPVIMREALGGAAPPGTFFDYAPIHLLTTATLDRLHELNPDGQFDARRFRPNILISPAHAMAGFAENAWLGQTLLIGSGLRLRAIDPSPRCVVTTLAQWGLPRDPGILRTIAQSNAAASVTAAPGEMFDAVAGIYAGALGDGAVQVGDALRLLGGPNNGQ